ncbi:MAG: DUF4249 domain-containing protein [Saprospiraceae bacterium]|nr:DUF4249 domain-containing protein [Saprospiraceae bacterium]
MDNQLTILTRLGFFFLFLTFLGCEKEIQLDIGEFQPKIVVNAFFQGGEAWEVHVCQSKNVLDSNPTNIDLPNAQVRIKNLETGKTIKLHHSSEGYFTNPNYNVEHGVAYEITASHPGFNPVKATADAPLPINVRVTHSETLDFNGKVALRVDFEINDDPGSENFYIYEILNLIPNTPENLIGLPFLESPIKTWLSSVDGNTGYIDDSTEKQSKLFITDHNFRGSILNTSLVSFVEIQKNKSNGSTVIPDDFEYTPDFSQSRLKVTGASREMYEYYKTVELIIQKEALNSSASTPIKPFSNIENGLGIFAGFTEMVIQVQE